MSRALVQRRTSLVVLGLFLVLLANLGLTVHSGHHSLVVPYSATANQYLAEHNEPDTTLHLENTTEVRTLSCPGCVLQQQIGGSHLPGLGSLDRPAMTESQVDVLSDHSSSRRFAASSPRGPPAR